MPLNGLRHPAGQMWTLHCFPISLLSGFDASLRLLLSFSHSLSLLLTSLNAELSAVGSEDYCLKKNLLNVWFRLGFLLWLQHSTGQRRFTWL